MEKTTQILVSEAKAGSHEAFRAIFDRTEKRVFSYVFSHVKKRDDAMDLTQDVFVDLWRALSGFSYRSEEEFYGFLFLIVRRKLGKYYRTANRTVSIEEHEMDFGEEEHREDYRFLLGRLETIAEHYRELLRLRYWGGMKLAEAAAVLGVSEGTAKVWHYRALEALRAKMGNYEQM